jgi:predicted transcriptional regulator YdeE
MFYQIPSFFVIPLLTLPAIAKLYLNEEDDKPGRVMLWKEIHDKYEKQLNDYAKQFREEEDDYDDFDYFVAREQGRELAPKMKMTKTETFQAEGELQAHFFLQMLSWILGVKQCSCSFINF